MMTATQAKEKTKERLRVIAEEFITNNVGVPIQEAIDNGRFFCTVSFKGVPDPEQTGEEVVRLLKLLDYEAEHVYYDGPNGYENYILIKWEAD